MFKVADQNGLNRRLAAVAASLVVLSAFSAMAPAGSMFRDTQAALVAGAISAFLMVAASGVRIQYNAAHLGLGGFILISLLATVTSVSPTESLLEVGLIAGYLVFFLTAANIVGGNRVRLAGHLLVLMATLVTAGAAYAYTVGYNRQIQELAAAGNEGLARQLTSMIDRAFGNFPSANSFAGFLILFIPIAIGLLLSEDDIRLRLWLAFAVIAMSAALYFTFSKGALLAVALGLTLMLFGRLSLQNSVKVRVALPFGLAVLAGVYVFGVFYGFSPAAFVANVGGRVELWRGAAAIAMRHPILGVGPGAFATEFTHIQAGPVFSRYAHNTYLQIAAEQGLVGLFVMILAIGAIVARAWRLMAADKTDSKWLRLGFVGSLVAFSVHNFVDYTWYIPGVALAFWLIAGLAVGVPSEAPVAGAQPTLKRWVLVGVVAASLVPTMLAFMGGMLIARANHHKGDLKFAEAEAEYNSALRVLPFSAEAYDGLAQTLYFDALVKKRRLALRAIEYQRRAIELRPTWPHYHARLGEYLAFAGRRREALGEYALATKLYPVDPEFKVRLGNYLLALNRPAEAAKVFREAVGLADVYHAERWTPAVLATARGDARDPIIAIASAYTGLAESYSALGRRSAARSMVTKAERILGRTQDMAKLKERINRAGAR